MSTAPFPAIATPQPLTLPDQIVSSPVSPVRRRATSHQAEAIQKLGSAIDHLSYAHIFLNDRAVEKADTEAIHILLKLRRSVFEECQQVIAADRDLRQWFAGLKSKRSN